MAIATISPEELAARHERGDVCELIDVRTPVEFREVHELLRVNDSD
jgi:rhodanese-related sulfurtransferase